MGTKILKDNADVNAHRQIAKHEITVAVYI